METTDWGYVITTLVIRYAAIFIVLSLLIVLLTINGRIVSALAGRKKKQKQSDRKNMTKKDAGDSPEDDPNIPVAIGLAMGLYNASKSNDSTPDDGPEAHSEWKMAGRVVQWRQKPGRR